MADKQDRSKRFVEDGEGGAPFKVTPKPKATPKPEGQEEERTNDEPKKQGG